MHKNKHLTLLILLLFFFGWNVNSQDKKMHPKRCIFYSSEWFRHQAALKHLQRTQRWYKRFEHHPDLQTYQSFS